MRSALPSTQHTEIRVFPSIWTLMQAGAADPASTHPKGKFLWKPGKRGNPPTSQLPARLVAAELPFLPLSHTSLHLCKSLGDVRSFFQLLQVSVKPAADSSTERGAVARGKPEAAAVPPPRACGEGQEKLLQRAPGLEREGGTPQCCRGSLQAGGRLPPLPHEHRGAPAAACSAPRFGSRCQAIPQQGAEHRVPDGLGMRWC